MKKIISLFFVASLSALTLNAQKSKLRSVGVSLSQDESIIDNLIDAKNAIDQATIHPTTMEDPRMFLYRSMTYARLNEKKGHDLFKELDLRNSGYEAGYYLSKFYNSSAEKNSVDLEDAKLNGLRSFVACYNESNALVARASYDSLLNYMEFSKVIYDNLDTASIRLLNNNSITKSNIEMRYIYFATKISNSERKNAVLEKYPDVPLSLEARSNDKLEKKDTIGAEAILINAFKKDTKNEDVFNVLKNFYIRTDRNKLLSFVNDLIKSDENNSGYFYLRGKLKEEQEKNYKGAKQDYLKAIELDEYNYDANFDLGVLIMNKETIQPRTDKLNANTDAQRAAANSKLNLVYLEAEKYLLIASDNKDYDVNDKINIYKALKTIYLETDNKEKEIECTNKINLLQVQK